MMNDNCSISRRVDIELDRIRPDVERFQEGGNGILWKRIVSAPMRDALRTAPGWWGQRNLRVVAFGR
jgi:hypothetical protein